MKKRGIIYLIHFNRPIGSADPDREGKGRPPRKRNYHAHAKHYLGFAEPELFSKRIQKQRASQGSKLVRAANRQSITWKVVRTWEGTRHDERRLKLQKNTPRFCPCCNVRLATETYNVLSTTYNMAEVPF